MRKVENTQEEKKMLKYLEKLKEGNTEFIKLPIKQILPFWKKHYKIVIAFVLAVAITVLFYKLTNSNNFFVAFIFLLVLGYLSMVVLLPIIKYILAPLLFNILLFIYIFFALLLTPIFGLILYGLNELIDYE